jgi:hypothetical protein
VLALLDFILCVLCYQPLKSNLGRSSLKLKDSIEDPFR